MTVVGALGDECERRGLPCRPDGDVLSFSYKVYAWLGEDGWVWAWSSTGPSHRIVDLADPDALEKLETAIRGLLAGERP